MAREKLYSASMKQKQAETKNHEQAIKGDPSTTGLQWAAVVQQSQQPQNVKETKQIQQTNNAANSTKKYQLTAPSIEDTAVLSTAVSMNEESIESLNNNVLTNFMRKGVNLGALEESYKEIYKKSKSHNLLLERFMANIKMSGISAMMSLCGVEAEEIERMKKEIREKALKEIDVKLSQDWAYAKVMLEIMG